MKILILLVLMAISAAQAERILFLGVVGSKSHKIGYMPIAEALAAKGHQVVVVNPFPGVGSSNNVREIIVRDIVSDLEIDWFEMQKDNAITVIKQQINMFSMVALNAYDSLIENAEFQKIFQERAIDLIVMDCIGNDFAMPLVDHLKVPFVYYSPTSAIPQTVEALGIPKDYASVPAGMLDITPNMTFLQRLGNMFTSEMFVILRKMILLPELDERARRDFPNARPIAEIERDASLCLMNHHPVTAYPRTLPPHVIPIGGLHVRPAKLLPEVIH